MRGGIAKVHLLVASILSVSHTIRYVDMPNKKYNSTATEVASGQDPGLGGLFGQPAGLRVGRVGRRLGSHLRGKRRRAAAEHHARHLQLGRQSFW